MFIQDQYECFYLSKNNTTLIHSWFFFFAKAGKRNPQPKRTEINLHMNTSQPVFLPTEQMCETETIISRPLGLQSLKGLLKPYQIIFNNALRGKVQKGSLRPEWRAFGAAPRRARVYRSGWIWLKIATLLLDLSSRAYKTEHRVKPAFIFTLIIVLQTKIHFDQKTRLG